MGTHSNFHSILTQESAIYFQFAPKKNNSCLFESFFNAKKNGVFLLGISFFFLEIYTFLYYANEESDDVIDGSTKRVQHSIKNISRNIRAVFFKPGTRNVHQKRNRMTPTMLLPWQHSAPVSFCKKPNIPTCNLLKWDRGFSSAHKWFPCCLNYPH